MTYHRTDDIAARLREVEAMLEATKQIAGRAIGEREAAKQERDALQHKLDNGIAWWKKEAEKSQAQRDGLLEAAKRALEIRGGKFSLSEISDAMDELVVAISLTEAR